MTRTPMISFGDLLRALAHLDDGDTETRRRIAALLGFDWSDAGAAARLSGRPDLRVSPEITRPEAGPTRLPDPARPPASTPHDDASAPVGEDDAWVEALPASNLRLPKWFDAVKPLPQAPDEDLREPPAIDPLFRPDWTRALLYAALATVDDQGPFDVERLVERLARGEPLGLIPRQLRRHLGAGVQVLIDISKAMSPYVEDQRGLLDAIRRVSSAELVREAIFEAVPVTVAFAAEGWQWREYQPPPRGTLVLALTDLSAGRVVPGVARGAPEAWLSFCETLRVAGCPFVVINPYPESRISPVLRRRMAIVSWDRITTTGQVQRTRRAAGKGER